MKNDIQSYEQASEVVTPAAASVPQPAGAESMMAIISKAATDERFDVEKLERLMGMYERMQDKQAEVEFNSAMAQMQVEIPSIAERGVGHNIKYATLEDILDVVRPIMHKYGFALVFKVDNTPDSIKVTGVLMHAAGHSIETSMSLPSDTSGSKNRVQALGSSTSYGKRYVLSALLNIATRGEDDNGYGAVPDISVTVAQAMTMQRLLDKCKPETVAGFTKLYGQPTAVSKSDFNTAMAQLEVAVKRDSESNADASD